MLELRRLIGFQVENGEREMLDRVMCRVEQLSIWAVCMLFCSVCLMIFLSDSLRPLFSFAYKAYEDGESAMIHGAHHHCNRLTATTTTTRATTTTTSVTRPTEGTRNPIGYTNTHTLELRNQKVCICVSLFLCDFRCLILYRSICVPVLCGSVALFGDQWQDLVNK